MVYAEETFMIFNVPVTIDFLGNAVGQGPSHARAVVEFLESKRLRYEDVNFQTDNEMYINEIVRRHTIRKGDIYFIYAYYMYFGSSKIGICEFTSDTQYKYWFYLVPVKLF